MMKDVKELSNKFKKKEANPVVVNCIYWNTRGLGDGFKRHLTLEQLEELGKSEVTLLSETKCKTKLEIVGKQTFQTQLSGTNGVVAIYNSPNAKKIKAINENLLWSSCRHDGALVHYFTIYIPPNNKEIADLTLRQLQWHLKDIFSIDKDSLVVVTGDFNIVGMKKSDFLEREFKLTP